MANNLNGNKNANGKWFGYIINDGGAGLVFAIDKKEAINKIRKSYQEHGGISDNNEITICETCSFQYDIIEAFEYAKPLL